MTSLCFNYDQISAAKGPQVQNRANSSKGTTFIKCEQELHLTNTSTAAFTGKSVVWATPGGKEEVSTASMTLPASEVINRWLCSILILLYLSQDFKEKASLNASANQKSTANSNKFHAGEKCHRYYNK